MLFPPTWRGLSHFRLAGWQGVLLQQVFCLPPWASSLVGALGQTVGFFGLFLVLLWRPWRARNPIGLAFVAMKTAIAIKPAGSVALRGALVLAAALALMLQMPELPSLGDAPVALLVAAAGPQR